MREIRVFENSRDLADAAAELLVATIRSVDSSRRCFIALSGGSTPRLMYGTLSRMDRLGELFNQRVEFFFSDERAVGPDHPESNYRLARERLFEPVGVAEGIIHRMKGETADLSVEADRYEALIRTWLPQGPEGNPRFDLTLLGMGDDGHTASLFPELDLESPEQFRRLVIAPYVESKGTHRLSFTVSLINHSRMVLLLVAGESKSAAVKQVLSSASGVDILPAARVDAERTIWMLDSAAASALGPDDDRIKQR